MLDPRVGDLVVFRTMTDGGIARVDLVRDRHVTAFPWRQADRRWERRRSRIDRRSVVAVLPGDADPAPIADQLNVLRNLRAAERQKLDAAHRTRLQGLLAQLGGGA